MYNEVMKKLNAYESYENNLEKYFQIKEKKYKKERWYRTFFKLIKRYTNGIYFPIKALWNTDINIFLKLFLIVFNITLTCLSIIFTVDVLFNIRLGENTLAYTIEVLFTLVPFVILFVSFRYLTGVLMKLISHITK